MSDPDHLWKPANAGQQKKRGRDSGTGGFELGKHRWNPNLEILEHEVSGLCLVDLRLWNISGKYMEIHN